MKDIPRLIGLTGTNGAGKGAAAAFFLDHGFAYLSLSDLVREELAARRLEPTRNNMIREGNRLRRTHGPDVLAARILDRVRGPSVIDSIRNPEEIRRLRRHNNFILLAVDAPISLRYERVRTRGREESAGTLEEFRSKEQEEMSGQKHGQQLQVCLEMADALIVNDGTVQDLYDKLEAYL